MDISSHGTVGIDECLVFGSFGFIKAPYGDYWKFIKKQIVSKMLGPQALERSRDIRALELERFYTNILDKATKKQKVEIGEETLRLVNTILGKMSVGKSFSEEDEAKVSVFTGEFAAVTQKIFVQQVLRKPLEKFGIVPFKKEVMDVSDRFGEVLESILEKYVEKFGENHEGGEIMETLLEAYLDENAEYKITKNHIKSISAVNSLLIYNY
ncbi:unnamed protein product [Cochlearia groenlandica]